MIQASCLTSQGLGLPVRWARHRCACLRGSWDHRCEGATGHKACGWFGGARECRRGCFSPGAWGGEVGPVSCALCLAWPQETPLGEEGSEEEHRPPQRPPRSHQKHAGEGQGTRHTPGSCKASCTWLRALAAGAQGPRSPCLQTVILKAGFQGDNFALSLSKGRRKAAHLVHGPLWLVLKASERQEPARQGGAHLSRPDRSALGARWGGRVEWGPWFCWVALGGELHSGWGSWAPWATKIQLSL